MFEFDEGEGSLTDMQTKLLLAAIADIFVTSQSLGEAYERFKRVTNSAGILLEDAKPGLKGPDQ